MVCPFFFLLFFFYYKLNSCIRKTTTKCSYWVIPCCCIVCWWLGRQDKSENRLQSHECCFGNRQWSQTVARRISSCHSFIDSPGGNFTRASLCLSLYYGFSYIIGPPERCLSHWRRKRKDRVRRKKQFQSLQRNLWELQCFHFCLLLPLSSFISFNHTFKWKNIRVCINTGQIVDTFLFSFALTVHPSHCVE